MLKWMEITAVNLQSNVTAFYGIYNPDIDHEFSLDMCYYSQNNIFKDGEGILNNSNRVTVCYLIMFISLAMLFM